MVNISTLARQLETLDIYGTGIDYQFLEGVFEHCLALRELNVTRQGKVRLLYNEVCKRTAHVKREELNIIVSRNVEP